MAQELAIEREHGGPNAPGSHIDPDDMFGHPAADEASLCPGLRP